MGDAFQRVALPMGKVVHRVDAPIVSSPLVMRPLDAIDDGVPHVHVGVTHVNFGAQHTMPIWVIPRLHFLKQLKVVFNRAVAMRAVGARRRRTALLLSHGGGILVVDVGLSVFDEARGKGIERIEMIAGVEFTPIPCVPQPGNIPPNGIYIFLAFLLRIGVVEPQIDQAVVAFSQSK